MKTGGVKNSMSNISWVGNKVFDSVAPAKTVVSLIPAQQGGALPMPQTALPQTTLPLEMQQGPPPSTEPGFIPYYLSQNIGRNVRAEFIVGTSQYVDKTGVLIEVGINYFVLLDVNSRAHIMCDLYSVRFVTILQP